MLGRNTRDLGKGYAGEAGWGRASQKGFSEVLGIYTLAQGGGGGAGPARRAVRRGTEGNRMKCGLTLCGWSREFKFYHRGSGSHLVALR